VNRLPTGFLPVLLLTAFLSAPLAAADKKTVCTITVNSDDEYKTFRRFLPAGEYKFVELVEKKRRDWLGSACEAKVSCDMLIISGHHGEGNVFFSDALDRDEFLPLSEIERVACSGSCPSLFANLKEVYLFGCNTLNSQPQLTASDEITRSYVREGRPPAEASRLARLLQAERGESSRDRMGMVFKDVPVIYGFSSVAPLGPVAGSLLNRQFQASGTGEIGKGRVNAGLLRQFSQHSMVAIRGMTAGDRQAAMREDVCKFADDRMTDAQRLAAIHQIMQRPTAESRMLLDRIEAYTESLDDAKRKQPDVAQALERIAADTATKDRYLAFARDADHAQTRARMIEVAHDLHWLNRDQRRDEIVRMFGDLLARKTIDSPDVDLACSVNKARDLDGALDRLALAPGQAEGVGHSAILACMGSAGAHPRALKGLVSSADADVRIAQAYLRHRPIKDADELRAVTSAIAGMDGSEAQARALDTLGRHYLSDRESVDTLKRLFAKTRSWPVQNAIAGVLIRADPKSIASQDLLRTLREFRLKASPGDNMVDALIQRLQLS
jgi:hypothetical protein